MSDKELAEMMMEKIRKGYLIEVGREPTQEEVDTIACAYLISFALGADWNEVGIDQRNSVVRILAGFRENVRQEEKK